ncbi:MAG: exodeoxyribonuclease VII small subunit [Deltaproteobacteria bacterium]|jgi:exodeoxyribonuclease VII small subunit|nr:exodeoxyribonuclease VII small subunit [Deltaproteobacteria bacterium]
MTAKKKQPAASSTETFEDGLKRLESIVNDLENKSLNLDTALEAFEAGIKLSQELSVKLRKAERKLEKLTKGPDGRPRSTPLSDPQLVADQETDDEYYDQDDEYDEEDEEGEYDEDDDIPEADPKKLF